MYKITNSYGVYDAYKAIRKQGWFNIGRPLTEKEFYTIIRQCNSLVAEALTKGTAFTIPYNLGTLELRKTLKRIFLKDGRYYTNNPIDWKSTKDYWEQDKEAAREKVLIHYDLDEIYRILYNKRSSKYTNKKFIKFKPIRKIKQALVKEINNGHIDAFLLKVRYD